MKKPVSDQEQWKMAHYYIYVRKHLKCNDRPYFGSELWKHLTKCEVEIPEPEIVPV